MEVNPRKKPLDHAGRGLKTLDREDGEGALADAVVLTRLDEVVNWGRRNSLWPLPYATACCGIEFMGVVSSVFDISRFGAELVRFSPRQADLLIVAGTVNYKQAPILKRIYDQMSDPKWVIAMGVCASSGGFYDNYCTLQGIDKVIPVDYYVGGCPPRPEALLETILDLQKRITRNKADLG
jgi:NADH-quinone oxidoreductase subunit B